MAPRNGPRVDRAGGPVSMTASPVLDAELHEAADSYNALGWRTIVVSGKVSMGAWKRPWSISKVHKRIDDPDATGLAVLLGEPSGGLVARDFDEPDAFQRWSDAKRGLAEVLPISLTGREGGGYHVFALMPGQKIRRFGDGELRGNGAYVVIPPSIHPSGSIYSWLTPPGGPLPMLSPADLNAVLPIRTKPCIKVATQQYKYQPNTNTNTNSNTRCDITEEFAYSFGDEVMMAIVETQPNRVGERHYRLWEFARRMRSVLPIDTPESELLPFVREWHRMALPNISTKDFLATWRRFLDAWHAVEHPFGSGLQIIVDLAEEDEYRTGLRNTNLDLVARVFRAESATHSGQPFPFSYRALGWCCKLTARAAQRLALQLRDEGLVAIVSDGIPWRIVNCQTVKSRVATVWRWTGPARMPAMKMDEDRDDRT
jgi:hypothetical protein